VSVVQFRPWPPLSPTISAIVLTLFAIEEGDLVPIRSWSRRPAAPGAGSLRRGCALATAVSGGPGANGRRGRLAIVLTARRSDLSRIVRRTGNELEIESVESEAWLLSQTFPAKLGRGLDLHDRADQDLLVA
jgi:hypothetical protein